MQDVLGSGIDQGSTATSLASVQGLSARPRLRLFGFILASLPEQILQPDTTRRCESVVPLIPDKISALRARKGPFVYCSSKTPAPVALFDPPEVFGELCSTLLSSCLNVPELVLNCRRSMVGRRHTLSYSTVISTGRFFPLPVCLHIRLLPL